MLVAVVIAEIAVAGIVVAAIWMVVRLVARQNADHAETLTAVHRMWADVLRPPEPASSGADLEARIRDALDARLPVELPQDPEWIDTYDPDNPTDREVAGGLRPGEPIHPGLPREDPPFA